MYYISLVSKLFLKFIYFFNFSSFRTKIHESVCYFELFLNKFLKGENFKNNISLGWEGVCGLIQKLDYLSNDNNDINTLNNIFDLDKCKSENNNINIFCQKDLNFVYDNLLLNLKELELSKKNLKKQFNFQDLIMNRLNLEFFDNLDETIFIGLIYNEIKNKIQPLLEYQKNVIGVNINPLFKKIDLLKNNIQLIQNNLNDLVSQILSSGLFLINNMINIIDIFSLYQKILLLFSYIYLFLFCLIIFIFIIYILIKISIIYFIFKIIFYILILIIISFIFLSIIFIYIQYIIEATPNILNYLLTGNNPLNSKDNIIPQSIGNLIINQNYSLLYNICLNEDGNLLNLILKEDIIKTILYDLKELKKLSIRMSDEIKNIINKSNIRTNSFSSIDESIIYSTIIKYKQVLDNLYITNDYVNFGQNNIKFLLDKIRENLLSRGCGKFFEYFVIKKSDCPKNSIISNTILEKFDNKIHCYVIPNLLPNTTINYMGFSCQNDYINYVINFIKEVHNIIQERIDKLLDIQNKYSNIWNSLNYESNLIHKLINNSYTFLYDKIYNNIYKSVNCKSIRYNLIEFSQIYGKEARYKAKLISIFGILSGFIGFIILYCLIAFINGFLNDINFNDDNLDDKRIIPIISYNDIEDIDYNENNNENNNINIKIIEKHRN